PNTTFDRDPRDTATPLGYAEFLRRLYGTSLLKPASRDFLFSVMRRCLTGSNRIKGLLPPGTPVEHKTGTLAGITDDVGFISLSDGRRVIVAAFARGGSNRPTLIARAARAVYDAFAAAP
ncbi:MAG: class A beta-lactamase-related serine hydrolase, partial [Sphingomonadales bacterium]|nr:class A beta-lactamase-related serine hydrolase [Sphingomonadales bacterium]